MRRKKMDGLGTARMVLSNEKFLRSLYRRLRDQVTDQRLRGTVRELIDLQDDQIDLLNELIDELREEPDRLPSVRFAQYVVQRGDTLFIIAQKYNTTVARLLRVNPDIEDPDEIQAGMVINLPIILPRTPESFEEYTVQSGDTLFDIAQQFDTTVNDLVFYNNVRNPDLIFPGRILIIPYREEEEDREMELSYETIARNNDMNFDTTLEESFFTAATRSQLRRQLRNLDIRLPRNINFNENIVLGAVEYNIRNLTLMDTTIRVAAEQKARGYHLISVPKDQFLEEGIYNIDFVAVRGDRLDRDRIKIRF